MSPIAQAPKNSTESSTGNSLLTFSTFDRIIEEHARKKAPVSFRMIYEKDIPELVEGLREWLIRTVGCFMTVGHCRIPDLTYWYEHDAIAEEFEDLLIEFKDYLSHVKGIDVEKDYTLLRYCDNLTFILMEGKNGLDVPIMDIDPLGEARDHLEKANKLFDELCNKLHDEIGEYVNVDGFMQDLAPPDLVESLFKKHLTMRAMDEKYESVFLQYPLIVPDGKTL